MTPAIWTALATVVGVVVGVVGSRRLNAAMAKKADAEAAKVVHEMALSLINPMQAQIDQLRAENSYLAADMAAMKGRLGMVEDDRDTLVSAVRVHAAWEDDGRPDPPGAPALAADVRAILDRLHTNA